MGFYKIQLSNCLTTETGLYRLLYCTVLQTVLYCALYCTVLYCTADCTVLQTVLYCKPHHTMTSGRHTTKLPNVYIVWELGKNLSWHCMIYNSKQKCFSFFKQSFLPVVSMMWTGNLLHAFDAFAAFEPATMFCDGTNLVYWTFFPALTGVECKMTRDVGHRGDHIKYDGSEPLIAWCTKGRFWNGFSQ